MKVQLLHVLALALTASATPISKEIALEQTSLQTLYSSDTTRNIFVKQIHSHNDYWRDVPLLTALSYGVQSVEADVWLYGEKLYVGHHEAALTSERTFDSLYINPLISILDAANPNNSFTADQTSPNGVFDTDWTATLYLFVDLKTAGNTTFPYIVKALQPLREKGYLTYFNGTDIVYGAVTVIGTGNTPFDQVACESTRDYFFDGPLGSLNSTYPATLNPIASASFLQTVGGSVGPNCLNNTQKMIVKKAINKAHELGIKTRFWDVPWWPVQKRNACYRQIIELQSDFLNADDLALASTFV
ncbi:hypothetical protein V1511DRAFT_485207 [Dipodascopsis uninucleata]